MPRRSEWVIAAFFVYGAILALFYPAPERVRTLVPAVNFGILVCCAVLAYAGRRRPGPAVAIVRDWFALALLLFAYQEMGWFAMPRASHDLETVWVAWDRAALHGGLTAAVEILGPALPAALEISYTLVYSLAPFSLGVLYACGRRERSDEFLFLFAAGVLLCYAQFPFWPSEPPRTVFPGEDFPRYNSIFRSLNFRMLGSYGIHTSVFPSAHVAGAFSTAFAMRRILPGRWPTRFLMAMALAALSATKLIWRGKARV